MHKTENKREGKTTTIKYVKEISYLCEKHKDKENKQKSKPV